MNYQIVDDLSKKYDIPKSDIIFIALNRYGVNYKEGEEEDRIRFTLKTDLADNNTFFAVCANTMKSPFTIKNNKLYFNEMYIGETLNLEKDTCSETYFRNGKKAMTINSNSRSTCKGCKFCGTYKLKSEEREHFDNEKEMSNFIEELLKNNNLTTMKDMEVVTLVTGCFKKEEDLINHIITLKKVFKKFDYDGEIGYVGSQIQTLDNLKKLKDTIEKFNLLITTEKFVNRELIMRPEKARMTLELSKKFLNYAKELGFGANFLYILGLEELDIFKKYMEYMKDSVNKFPQVQIYQNYTKIQESYRCQEALNFEYYLKARKILEEIFSDTNITPYSWENYRSLFYTEYNHKKYVKESGTYGR